MGRLGPHFQRSYLQNMIHNKFREKYDPPNCINQLQNHFTPCEKARVQVLQG